MDELRDGPGLSERARELLECLPEKILVTDGAMGTMIQQKHLSAEDFGGAAYEGCNEHLVLTRPDLIASIHAAYFEAGADIVETDTFGGTPLVLAEYGLAHRSLEINEAAARIAREAARGFPGPRFVAGSMGPTTKAITVTGGVTFDELAEHYRVQALGLLRGGADILFLETAQDTLNVKAGILGIRQAFREFGARVPLLLSATIEQNGTMLGGQAIDAFCASVEHAGATAIGLNCATGPEFMTDRMRTLSQMAACAVSCYPNAGLPDENGTYAETPEKMAEALGRFIAHGWINIVGGCCGTTPAHIRALAPLARAGHPRKIPASRSVTHVSGIDYVVCEESSRPLIVGERTNVNGSRKFRELIASEKFEEAAEIARRQVKAGAHLIDVCLTSTERDEAADLARFLPVATRAVKVPIMIDSMDAGAIERALRCLPGKAIINSINLEDGEERFRKVVPLVHRYGGAVVVGCIDEQGQAISADAKLRVAERSHGLLTREYALREEDIVWDALVFPCASGDANYVGSAAHTIEAVRRLKQKYPSTRTVLGISNVSFGLPEAGREVLNAAFLYHATKAGLDFAIVSSEKLVRYAGVSEGERRLCEDLLFNRGDDPIAAFAAFYRGRERKKPGASGERLPLDQRLARSVIEGSKEGLIEDLEEKLREAAPLDIINGPLMKGMQEVGRLFNNNELIVAEVLQSAEVMKAAVAHLERYMTHAAGANKGKIVLATVKGDVHDIGKNLVDIILSNNGYTVVNLGIKVAPETIIRSVQQEQPDLIGLSGLLVKSAQQMVATVEDFRAAGIGLPVLVGGAALTRKFTYTRIRPQYDGPVIYARDAMQGLDLANRLVEPAARAALVESVAREAASLESAPATAAAIVPPAAPIRAVERVPPRRAPSLARRLIHEPVSNLWPYLNRQMLYGKHLGLRGSVETLQKAGDPKFKEVDAVVREVAGLAERGWMSARAVYQFFAAASEGNAIVLFDGAGNEIERFSFPRQTASAGGLCLSDFVSPAGEVADSIALFVVTCGEGIRERAAELKAKGEYLLSHTLSALALESAEALAELVHRRLRAEWGIGDPSTLTLREIHKAAYTGLRVSFGYPACPNLSDQDIIWRLLKPEEIGVQLTEGFVMDPEASVSALVLHHPQARYFSVDTAE